MTSNLDVMEASPCEDVDRFAARMLVRAYETGCTVLGEHNEHTLEARPGMTTKDILKPWNEAQRRSYLGLD